MGEQFTVPHTTGKWTLDDEFNSLMRKVERIVTALYNE